ncbi:MAG TPA: ECF transporter S component [Candidatus Methanomethylicus sp.]|nr:ECF transporter S component [Candidatus Methanomethylicus sp.]
MDGYTIHIMPNGSAKRSRTKRISYTAMMIALAVALRLLKNSLFGPFQFVNFPGVFTVVSGIIFGPTIAMVVGAGSYLLSDVLIGLPGYYTLTNMFLMGGIGLITGLIWKRSNRTDISKIGIGVGTYIIMLAFDIISSFAFYAILGVPMTAALAVGIGGLFMPSGGGVIYGIGPITEAATAILVVMIAHVLLQNKMVKT